MPRILLAKIFQIKYFWQKTILDLGIGRFGGYHAADLVESFRMSYESSQTEQTSPHYDQNLHLHLHLGGHNGRPRGDRIFWDVRLPSIAVGGHGATAFSG